MPFFSNHTSNGTIGAVASTCRRQSTEQDTERGTGCGGRQSVCWPAHLLAKLVAQPLVKHLHVELQHREVRQCSEKAVTVRNRKSSLSFLAVRTKEMMQPCPLSTYMSSLCPHLPTKVRRIFKQSHKSTHTTFKDALQHLAEEPSTEAHPERVRGLRLDADGPGGKHKGAALKRRHEGAVDRVAAHLFGAAAHGSLSKSLSIARRSSGRSLVSI